MKTSLDGRTINSSFPIHTHTGYLCRYILVATARSTFIPATASTVGGQHSFVHSFSPCSRDTYVRPSSHLHPPFSTQIITAGASGILSGLVGYFCRSVAIQLTSHLKAILEYIETPGSGLFQIMMGALIGFAMCYGSQVSQ